MKDKQITLGSPEMDNRPKPKTVTEFVAQMPAAILNMKIDHAVLILNPSGTNDHEIIRLDTSAEDARQLFAFLGTEGNMVEFKKSS